MIQLHNVDCIDFIQTLPAGSIDVICIDPPYLYLKNQKLERPFDERLFFSECKRVLTDKGFVVMFGRGVSFYRWNCLLDELGMTFKEEIVWDKIFTTSPVLPLQRCHETVALFAKGEGKVNKVKVDYVESNNFDPAKMQRDINRIMSSVKSEKGLKNILEYLEDGNEFTRGVRNTGGGVTVAVKDLNNNQVEKSMFRMLIDGVSEKSIIRQTYDRYTRIHPTQKPVRLLERLLALVIPDKPRNEIVVADFFAGSMSCMEAVHNMGMNGIACEIDQEYFEAGKKRIDELLSKPIQSTLL